MLAETITEQVPLVRGQKSINVCPLLNAVIHLTVRIVPFTRNFTFSIT